MPATYEPISSITLSATSASVTFSDIPQTFTDLVLVCWAGTDQTNDTTSGTSIWFNGDTSAIYSRTALRGTGSVADSVRVSNQTEMACGQLGASGLPFAPMFVSVMSYSNTNVFKTALSHSGNVNGFLIRSAGLWRSTAAVTSLSIRRTAGTWNLVSGSQFSLYGIKAA